MGKRAMRKGVTAGAVALALACGPALAGEWQVRMPVQKTARMTLPEPAQQDAQAEAAKPAAAEPKTALGRAAQAAAVSAAAGQTGERTGDQAPKAKAPRTDRPAQPRAEAKPQPEPSASQHKEPEASPGPVAAAKAQPAPKARTTVDPKALVQPQPKPQGAPLPLPPDGKWVGDLSLEYQPDRVILHIAANGSVERATWFNLAEAGEPRKLAVDLRGPWRKKGAAVVRCDTGPVKAVVVGEHEDRLRLSIEFREGAVARELDPGLDKRPDGLAVTIPLAVRLGQPGS